MVAALDELVLFLSTDPAHYGSQVTTALRQDAAYQEARELLKLARLETQRKLRHVVKRILHRQGR